MKKARIRQNRYDNWYGYVGTRRVMAFPNTIPGYGARQAAEDWLEGMKRVDRAFTNDAKREHLFDENGRRK